MGLYCSIQLNAYYYKDAIQHTNTAKPLQLTDSSQNETNKALLNTTAETTS